MSELTPEVMGPIVAAHHEANEIHRLLRAAEASALRRAAKAFEDWFLSSSQRETRLLENVRRWLRAEAARVRSGKTY